MLYIHLVLCGSLNAAKHSLGIVMKTVLITGATDGIGFETAKMFLQRGLEVIIHGRSKVKLASVKKTLLSTYPKANVDTLCADLSIFDEVRALVDTVNNRYERIDVIINNAGVFNITNSLTQSGLDARFMVNTIAPYMLTLGVLKRIPPSGRVVNVSSAAQAAVNFDALRGEVLLSDAQAYAQSKLAITMWTMSLGERHAQSGPRFVSVNPKSLLGSKMVKEAYGIAGGDLKLGASIFVDAALSSQFENVCGEYFDNDHGVFATPHQFAMSADNRQQLINTIEAIIAKN